MPRVLDAQAHRRKMEERRLERLVRVRNSALAAAMGDKNLRASGLLDTAMLQAIERHEDPLSLVSALVTIRNENLQESGLLSEAMWQAIMRHENPFSLVRALVTIRSENLQAPGLFSDAMIKAIIKHADPASLANVLARFRATLYSISEGKAIELFSLCSVPYFLEHALIELHKAQYSLSEENIRAVILGGENVAYALALLRREVFYRIQ